jgi:hypothetical protein
MVKKIRCIDPGTNTTLTLNAEYEVDHESTHMYYLVGVPGAYNKSRFVEVSTTAIVAAPIFVKCIDPGDGSILELGKVYQVSSEDSIRYYLKEFAERPNGFTKKRFEVVRQPTASSSSAGKPTIKEVLSDIDEERCWKALMPTPEPGNCKCGTHRSMCWIHKDQPETRS